jgi:hypothetical protein
MSETTLTPFSNRCDILAELWINYRSDDDFADFIYYNDLGLPIAYAVSAEIIPTSAKAEMFINETFDLLLSALDIEDEGFDTLDDILAITE